jgi:hypothetical protein
MKQATFLYTIRICLTTIFGKKLKTNREKYMGSIKTWLIEVAVKRMGPSAIRGAILGICGWLVAKAGFLATFGIVYDGTTHIISVNLDKLNVALIALIPAVLAAVIKLVNHQGNQIINPPKTTT